MLVYEMLCGFTPFLGPSNSHVRSHPSEAQDGPTFAMEHVQRQLSQVLQQNM